MTSTDDATTANNGGGGTNRAARRRKNHVLHKQERRCTIRRPRIAHRRTSKLYHCLAPLFADVFYCNLNCITDCIDCRWMRKERTKMAKL